MNISILLIALGHLISSKAHTNNHHHWNPDKNDLSFKRINEEVEDFCCKRVSKTETIGYGLDGEMAIDIGECRQSCSKHASPTDKPLKREEFDRLLKKFPSTDPIQIYLSLQKRKSEDDAPSCLNAKCIPSKIRRERHFQLTGHQKEIDIIQSCECQQTPRSCSRVQNQVTVNVDTPYEQIIDIGRCSGPCDEGGHSTCSPVRNHSISIKGANGDECYSTISECQCVGSCYRSKEFFKVYDYTNVYEKGGNQSWDSLYATDTAKTLNGGEKEILEPLTKLIDIGKCEGSCATSTESKCLLWSSTNGTCLSSLYGGTTVCSPSKFATHSYMNKDGEKKRFTSVTACGCV